ncbi:hypothetical protein [Tenggerimyces flavus]|uniref:FtsX-like permease family protein n=1 Tax=Tenggerimyces flavus TaxID=1708749 RepID=A0ABV7YDZ4_9ACTN|nr:hypothetical protein [Tenggerimyces flavus]MBM7789148.1 hypothetical protein [Tenggerimyces flavus]
MISLVLSQLAARWGQAVTLFVLSVAATVVAVSVPAFAVAIDRAAVANERAAADASEFVVSVATVSKQPPAEEGEGVVDDGTTEDLTAYADARSRLAGFLPLTTVQIQVQGLDRKKDGGVLYSLIARDGFCRYVTFSVGRCPVGNRELALPANLAKKLKLRTGDQSVLTPVQRTQESIELDGPPVAITIVGVFEPRNAADPYWVAEDPLGQFDLPKAFTNRTTMDTIEHGHEIVWLDAVMPPRLLTPERIPVLRDQLDAAEQRISEEEGGFGAGLLTSLPSLLDRIEAHGQNGRALLPIAAVPVIVLCWFVIHLAVGHGMWGRRLEVGAVVLRGARWPTRAATVAGESLLPLLAGVPVGLLLAGPLVGMTGPGDGSPIGIDDDQLVAAGLAAAGTVAAGLLALRRELAGPVGRLLRQMAPRSHRLAVAAFEVLVIALGIVSVVELRQLGGHLVGVRVAAPVLVILAVAMLAALAVPSLLDLLGRWTLRRGRIGPAVAAFYLARRPAASARLLAVLVLVFGTLGFAAIATDVAAQGRQAEAQQLLGAPRVLEVRPINREAFLKAVRKADPGGKDAMAVVAAYRSTGDNPPLLAVDSTRLSHVAYWPERYGATRAAQAAELLRPPAREPTTLGDGELVANLWPDAVTTEKTLRVALQLVSADGDRVIASFGPLTRTQSTYRAAVSGCDGQCRVTGITASSTDDDVVQFGLTFGSLRQGDRTVLSAEQLADESRWRAPEGPESVEQLWANPTPDGLRLSQPSPQVDEEYELLAVDVPYPLPAITAGQIRGKLLPNLDVEQIRLDTKATMTGVPGLGAFGVLVDLEYAERLTRDPGTASSPQVWLSADAPDSIVAKLRDQGLVIAGDRTVETIRGTLDKSGAAMALQSYQLGAGVTVLVGLGALALIVVVDRRAWIPGMRALRAQGTRERTTTTAALWSYGGIVATSAVVGALAAGATWYVAGGRLPVGVEPSLLPAWPRWPYVLVSEILVVAVLAAAVVAGAWWQRRVVRQREERSG